MARSRSAYATTPSARRSGAFPGWTLGGRDLVGCARTGSTATGVRRAVDRPTPPVRESVPRASNLDPWREQIMGWLRKDRQLTAKRVRQTVPQ